jgi:CheY-like chemotaxis protein
MNATMAPYRVLVVDDRREMRDVMCSAVETLGSRVDVTAVPSGEEALLEIRLQNFDLLVADVLLPGINGMELMKKAKERRPDLKVILGLHHELDAITSVFTDVHGRIQAQAGGLPDASIESGLFPKLSASLSVSGKVAKFVGSDTPRDLLYFSGQKFDIFLAHVGESYALMEIIDPIDVEDDFGKIMETVYKGVGDLYAILLKMGIPMNLEVQADSEDDEIDENDLEIEAPVLDVLFQGLDTKVPGTKEVDAFWDSVTEGSTAGGVQNSDALTYDQALQLGLTPEEEDD